MEKNTNMNYTFDQLMTVLLTECIHNLYPSVDLKDKIFTVTDQAFFCNFFNQERLDIAASCCDEVRFTFNKINISIRKNYRKVLMNRLEKIAYENFHSISNSRNSSNQF